LKRNKKHPKKRKKYILGFWKSLIILASTIRSTKLIIEKTIIIQHIKDIKGHKKTKFVFSTIKIGEKINNEKKN